MNTSIFKRILVPSDFSDVSLLAIKKAREISPQAELLLLHVLPPISSVTGNVVASASHGKAAQQEAMEKLQSAASDLTDAACEVRFGNTAGEIVWRAADWYTDLIIMPARSHGALEHALLGSTTERVLRSAKCPVLVLPVDD
jgi:nucleotide-binding universal stress UspA family protein